MVKYDLNCKPPKKNHDLRKSHHYLGKTVVWGSHMTVRLVSFFIIFLTFKKNCA